MHNLNCKTQVHARVCEEELELEKVDIIISKNQALQI